MSKYLTAFLLIIGVFFRIFLLSSLPPAPYWEEVALGYDSYSILKTGKDHHGNVFPLTAFESFGDWKPSGYFYAAVPFIYIFDLSVFAIRLPSALAGIAIMLGIFALSKEFGINKNIALAVAAFSLWGIHFSRAAWEVNLATALLTWGVYLTRAGLHSQKNQLRNTAVGALLLAFSAYTYHATRVIAPLLYLCLICEKILFVQDFIGFKQIFKQLKKILLPMSLGLAILGVLMAPIFWSIGDARISNRFAETSIFTNLEPIIASNAAKEIAGNSFFSRVLYHRYWYFAQDIAIRFASHFTLDFLFISGDVNPRHSLQFSGHLYYLDSIFILWGLIVVMQRRRSKDLFLLAWLAIAVLPASVTYGTPHALRILPSMPVFLILIALGMQACYDWYLPRKKQLLPRLIIISFCIGYIAQFFQVCWFYTKIYPTLYAQEWQYGYEELFTKLETHERDDLKIYLTRKDGRPAMYYFFYRKIDPSAVQLANTTAPKDQGEFLAFANYSFVNEVTGSILESEDTNSALFVSSLAEFESLAQSHSIIKLDEVVGLDGKIVWVIYRLE